jgi:hypothetical protein
MAAANTYTQVPGGSVTVGTATTSVTFSSIPATYTDLVLVMQPAANVDDENVGIRFNGDTSSNYSYTRVGANNTSGTFSSNRSGSFSRINTTEASGTSTNLGNLIIVAHIMNYANTTTYKTVIARSGQQGGTYNGVELFAGTWRATPAAINSVTVMQGGTRTFSTGSTFNLYGITAA